jgi:hypothetical protein
VESIYYVLCWQCHRRCEHCYDDRFRPYHGDDLDRVVAESCAALPRIVANFPERMTYLDPSDPLPDGSPREKRGRIILAGGEVLHKAVREPILYPALDLLHTRYQGGVEIVVQTTGDLVTARIVEELIERRVDKISVAGLDAYHDGYESEAVREALREKLTSILNGHGIAYSTFGATPDSWIGPLWPRGRALHNELPTGTIEENFCNRWSGGLNFLRHRFAGSEVSVDPAGNVYPCCIKTKKPVGNLLKESLEHLLDRLAGDPVYEAISMGQPERMGLTMGWSVQQFLEKSTVRFPSGRVYQNLCIGCDAFHEEVLMRRLVTIQDAGQQAG